MPGINDQLEKITDTLTRLNESFIDYRSETRTTLKNIQHQTEKTNGKVLKHERWITQNEIPIKDLISHSKEEAGEAMKTSKITKKDIVQFLIIGALIILILGEQAPEILEKFIKLL